MAKREDPLRGRTLIGVAERIDLPDWGVDRLRVKIDTGARTSALHVDDVELLDDERVRFSVVLDRKRAHRRVVVEAPIARRATVRSSSGKAQHRIFVATTMRLGPIEKEIEISLASREPMIFRMLLGRTALAHDFVVDPVHRYLHSEAKPKKKKKKPTEPVEAVGEVPSDAEREAVAATEASARKNRRSTSTTRKSKTTKREVDGSARVKKVAKKKRAKPVTETDAAPRADEGGTPSTRKSEKTQSARRKKKRTSTEKKTTEKKRARAVSPRGGER